MPPVVLASLSFVTLTAAVWYLLCARMARKRSLSIVSWLSATIGGPDSAPWHWTSASDFDIHLQCPEAGIYRNCRVHVRLCPRQLWHSWLRWNHRKEEETLTLTADLEQPPRADFDLCTIRYVAKTRHIDQSSADGWQIHRVQPIVLATRRDWQQDVAALASAVCEMHPKCLINLRLAKTSPHFSVTIPLSAIAPTCEQRFELFGAIRAIAATASLHGQKF